MISITGNVSAIGMLQNGNMPARIHHTSHRRPAKIFLAEWLAYRGLTAEQLAGRMETSKSVISKLVNGRQRYNQDWLERIAYALNCEVRELYRPPAVPTAEELLSMMTPEARETAMNVLENLSKLRTGTDD